MSQYVSFVIQNWQNGADGSMRWKVCRVENGSWIRFPDASFVVRAWVDDDQQMVRGLIRHVQSGREMQFQSSGHAAEFLRAWLQGGAAQGLECDPGLLSDALSAATAAGETDG